MTARRPATYCATWLGLASFRPAAAVALALGVLAAPASAVTPGENGRIVFASGRSTNSDATARLHLLPVFSNSVGDGTVGSPFVPVGGQYRHPSWSPDRTKVVFANGTPGSPTTEEFDLFVYDFVERTLTPLDGTQVGDGLSSDRPAWSPDGTRIAYEHQPTDNSAERDIRVKTLGSGVPALALTSGAPVEGKPAWSPDSKTIYYSKVSGTDQDIVREPADNSGVPVNVLATDNVDEFQPAVSADGTGLCFTRQSTPGNTGTADVMVTSLPTPGIPVDISDNPAPNADYNCTWSPDGQMIAYVVGAFSTGRLVMKRADDTSPGAIELAQDDGANNFDGNPDWAPDGRPLCPDNINLTIISDNPVLIGMECDDTGPEYERTAVREFPSTDPANGTLGPFSVGDPSTVTYTPNPGFTGTDSFQFRSFDSYGFGTDTGTVKITVVAPGGGGGGGGGQLPTCGGRTATIVGSASNDTMFGFAGNDVIVSLGGNDTIRSGGGNDIVCSGSGRDRIDGGKGDDRLNGGSEPDRIIGGRGNDRLNGDSGNDSLFGNSGRDLLSGDGGNDSLFGDSGQDLVSGGSGNDRLAGGSGRDRLSGGAGRDQLNGGSDRDTCSGGKGRNRLTSCER
jgi:Tol biopolymer transport system component